MPVRKLRTTWSKRFHKLWEEGYKPLSATACVDFDGTICCEKYPECGKLLPKAKWGMITLRKLLAPLGEKVAIYSCRSHKRLRKEVEKPMIDYLDSHQVPYDRIERGYQGKPLVGRYFDERGIPRESVVYNWPEAIDSFIRSIEYEIETIYKARRKRLL